MPVERGGILRFSLVVEDQVVAIFLGTGRLPDDHEPRLAVARAENRLGTRLAKAAKTAFAHGVGERWT